MTSGRWFALLGVLLLGALGVSGILYVQSRSADFNRHAEVIETLGRLRHVDELTLKQVLAARFGMLNQYDPLNASAVDLARSEAQLKERIVATVPTKGRLDAALARLDRAVTEQRQTIEHFKAENSILRNSVYYLPTAASDLTQTLGAEKADVLLQVRGVVQAALVYNLVGDDSARLAYLTELTALQAYKRDIPAAHAAEFEMFLAHALVIRDKFPLVDGWVRRAIAGEVTQPINEIEGLYHDAFNDRVAVSNTYRTVLYGWSVALALAVVAAAAQLRRLYAGLERRVADRTADLAKALDALWGEMKLARKIQEALVPTSPSLAHCDVAASMKPAEDVGGDYYDVITMGGHEWILIGDVSGHGVPAGLIMMMCHTAVRTALRANPDLTPQELLSQVNVVLTENIKLLGEDKYMTMTALRRDPDGTISFAGAHQDVFVYRATSKAVDVLETEGAWLGIKQHIASSLSLRTLKLGAGDVLVVHTDGITEATRDGVLFDTTGLRGVLATAHGKTARQILEDTFRALDGFTLSDDATMLVVRQLE
jgi:serine phosphatase RsbU (regulator of sigma subunit)